MLNSSHKNLTQIGVFYDGNYFHHVSNYYTYIHERRSRISISGLHNFIRTKVAEEENTDLRLTQIVDSHYFRGRITAKEASQKENQLYYDRLFDDILMSEGVTTHYLPVKSVPGGYKQEKGIDVWLALEAFELAIYKKYSVVVLVASDGDYVPLVRKLNTLGIRVMILSWDFEYTDDYGTPRTTRTAQDLLEEVSYPQAMHEIIDNRLKRNDSLINNLFVPRTTEKVFTKSFNYSTTPLSQSVNGDETDSDIPVTDLTDKDKRYVSTILSLKNGFGFIRCNPKNIFFHYTGLQEYDFNYIELDDTVEFSVAVNEEGQTIATDIHVITSNISATSSTEEEEEV